ncbi:MAG: ABC transporter permease subunit [Coriobacteriales bacterium]|nr:ABC transporter permease subunit [Coriobacteriales bacterium]
MSKALRRNIILLIATNTGFVALVTLILLPGLKPTPSPMPLLIGICLIEALYLVSIIRNPKGLLAASWITFIVWLVFFIWELLTTKLNRMHPVLVPAPEAIFDVFRTQYVVLIGNVVSSMELLLFGALTALVAGVLLGLAIGWIKELRDVIQPIARVLAPIPSVVFAPYLVALMPSFRSASAMVIFLGLFWPTFLNMIIRVAALDHRVLESARLLELSSFSMVKDILLPYVIPSVVAGLRVQLTSSIMMLTFAEMLGAKSGMGYYIINYTNFANYTNVVAGIIVVGIVVTILNRIIAFIEVVAIKWH